MTEGEGFDQKEPGREIGPVRDKSEDQLNQMCRFFVTRKGEGMREKRAEFRFNRFGHVQFSRVILLQQKMKKGKERGGFRKSVLMHSGEPRVTTVDLSGEMKDVRQYEADEINPGTIEFETEYGTVLSVYENGEYDLVHGEDSVVESDAKRELLLVFDDERESEWGKVLKAEEGQFDTVWWIPSNRPSLSSELVANRGIPGENASLPYKMI